ncbi:MAG: hypothetical protein JRG74_01490 [Deltaproteobacteria bacterium]|nr:hypothetical protein [Deltaproteobacteria bacterium]MBW2164802.1 hypothetical protein [Deltaproteobacteria bacterium]
MPALSTVRDLLVYGGFPEPFMLQSETQSKRWSREYRSRIVREELADLEMSSKPSFQFFRSSIWAT